jgi:folate-binding protein YgfZ
LAYNNNMSNSTFYSKITVQGLEAEKFLQGQLTCDMRKASPDKAVLAAHCNPKGRIVSLFFLLKEGERFSLFLPQNLSAIALTNLKKYAQFSKHVNVQETVLTDISNWPFLKDKKELIEAGIPLIYANTSELFLPHDINLPQLGGVSFDKGCYTGQEIIARMQNLGKPKQHLYRLNFESGTTETAFEPGTKIYLPERLESEIGYLVDAVAQDKSLLALATLKDSILEIGQTSWGLALVIEGNCHSISISKP